MHVFIGSHHAICPLHSTMCLMSLSQHNSWIASIICSSCTTKGPIPDTRRSASCITSHETHFVLRRRISCSELFCSRRLLLVGCVSSCAPRIGHAFSWPALGQFVLNKSMDRVRCRTKPSWNPAHMPPASSKPAKA